MTERVQERRLAAVMCADVAGYSSLMSKDEAGTLAALKRLRTEIFAPGVQAHRGRIVKLMGDGALVEFPSVVDAVQCAVEIQTATQAKNAATTSGTKAVLRIGIYLGDIIIEGRDIYGDGVNLAARLEAAAPPGGIAICAASHDQVARKLDATFSDTGPQKLKNIADPVRIFQWSPPGTAVPQSRSDSPPALPDKPSIAVLPFDNMSGDPEQEYFADGVVEAITATLSRIKTFFVIARNSAFAYKGRAVNVTQIGRELGVAYVLEGSVQKSGTRLRITVQLIETAGGAHLWAEKYDGAVDDIFDLQDRITEQVAGAMQPSIRFAEIERSRRKPPQDLGAYDYAMRAMPHVWKLEKEDADTALDLLEQALKLDPDYPLALALDAWCWGQRSVYNWVSDIAEAKTQALSRAERAANLSSDDPLILAILGAVHTVLRNYGAARVLLERAIQLDPNSAWVLSRLGWLETYNERIEQAEAYFHRAIRLSPLDPMNFNNLMGLGSARQVIEDDAGAVEYFLRALQERPNAHWVLRNHAPALLGAGRVEEAKAAYETLMAAYPDFTTKQFRAAMVFSPTMLDRICGQLEELGVPKE